MMNQLSKMKGKTEKKEKESETIEIGIEVTLLEGKEGYTFKTWNGKKFNNFLTWGLNKRYEGKNMVEEEFERLLQERIPEIADKMGRVRPSKHTKQRLSKKTIFHLRKGYWLVELTEEEFKKLMKVFNELERGRDNPVLWINYKEPKASVPSL